MRFVPLIGAQGWAATSERGRAAASAARAQSSARPWHARCARRRSRSTTIDSAPTSARCSSGSATRAWCCLGEATHGTSEFYRMRARHHARADRARAASPSSPSRPTGRTPRAIDRYVAATAARRRSPTWRAVRALSDLDVAQPRGARASSNGCAPTTTNSATAPAVGFYGLDLYSLYHVDPRRARRTSTASIPTAARVARERYGVPHALAKAIPRRTAGRSLIGPLPRLRGARWSRCCATC